MGIFNWLSAGYSRLERNPTIQRLKPLSTLLAVMSYPGGNDALNRHLPFFQRQGADWLYIISTENDSPIGPPNAAKRLIGRDCYIEASHLPQRMVNTIKSLLDRPWATLILTEYDTLFINRIRVEAMEHAVAAHYAGGRTWGSKASGFHHNPWCFHREAAMNFVLKGQDLIDQGACGEKTGTHLAAPEGSPDVFFTYVCEQLGQPIQSNLWKEFSRNSFDIPGHLDEARLAYRNGYDIIHGIKTKAEFDYITGDEK